jgi:hypothetical protein
VKLRSVLEVKDVVKTDHCPMVRKWAKNQVWASIGASRSSGSKYPTTKQNARPEIIAVATAVRMISVEDHCSRSIERGLKEESLLRCSWEK